MRKFSNVVVGILAAIVCALITYITRDSSRQNFIFNLAFLAVMMLIMLVSYFAGFFRLTQTRVGLDRATRKLKAIASNGGTMASITSPGSTPFEVRFLDAHYQDYLTYLHKTNSPTDIGDYIGEFEINSYTHRRMLEMVPDLMTSLGILGTFVGLILGLRGFNPTSYEAMSSSVEVLIDGIKVAFVTSIYGLTLSMAFSYWLRGSLSKVSESLDRFLDTYYTTAVPPTDATATNHIIANQNAQTRLMSQMQKDLAEQLSTSISNNISPMVAHLDKTMDDFSQTVTMQQEQLLENIAQKIARTMQKEFFSEFLEMRKVMAETNRAQEEHLQFMQNCERKYQQDLLSSTGKMTRTMEQSADVVSGFFDAVRAQEDELSRFVSSMRTAIDDMARVNETNLRMTEQMEQLTVLNGDISRQMTELAELSERYTRSLASVQANNSDIADGISSMNDANIRMSDKIAKMNDLTVSALTEAQKNQSDYLKAADEYYKSINSAASTLLRETQTQQENLREFTEYMTQVLSHINDVSQAAASSSAELNLRMDTLQKGMPAGGNGASYEQMQRVIELLEAEAARKDSGAGTADQESDLEDVDLIEEEEMDLRETQAKKKRRGFWRR